ncbi:N-acetylglucosamine kinase [Aureivirga sp. CE67]|uniref:N-acetylglucosamine kinase n=1 Tax=Aureivirga sp. CE67 TaxID=1788983 RepID=UPI0018CA172F|nr:N-acetylglucosamine kinase [Aureivirga sp. CE67]
MILIAEGGSTKVDWIALNDEKEEIFRLRTAGLNPTVFSREIIESRIVNDFQLVKDRELVKKVFFYGAGCGTDTPKSVLNEILKGVYYNAEIVIGDDMLGAVYAASQGQKSIVCILGTGSNSCYFDGENVEQNAKSLGYILMDEASGNYFGKQLICDYYYHRMPKEIAEKFEQAYNLDADFIKYNLYSLPDPNAYLASFSKFLFEHIENSYIKQIMLDGFENFFMCRILPYTHAHLVPIYFIGSIAYYFQDVLETVASKYNLEVAGVIQSPIDDLITYHKNELL